MAMKNMVEVVIAGRVYKISGYESPEYLHQIAVYLNDKMSELQNMDSYRKQNTDQKQLLLNMNLADDFFKAKRQADKLTGDLEKKERELYGVRHDLIEAQLALENQKKELEDLKAEKKAREKELASLKSRKRSWNHCWIRRRSRIRPQGEPGDRIQLQRLEYRSWFRTSQISQSSRGRLTAQAGGTAEIIEIQNRTEEKSVRRILMAGALFLCDSEKKGGKTI